jgi:cell division protease FtsH
MFTKPYSDETARVIDEEVSKLVESQYQRAVKVLTENKDKLTELALKLLTSEVIFKEDLEQIFGKRPWDSTENVISESQEEGELLESSKKNTDQEIAENSSQNNKVKVRKSRKSNVDEISSENPTDEEN